MWWNTGYLAARADKLLRAYTGPPKTVYVASSRDSEPSPESQRWKSALQTAAGRNIAWSYQPMPGETHATIYHPAALQAFRVVFKPRPLPGTE